MPLTDSGQFCCRSGQPDLTVTAPDTIKLFWAKMEKRLGFGATSGPAISVVKRVAYRVGYGRVRVLLVHISVC